jgi:hypothetical protein
LAASPASYLSSEAFGRDSIRYLALLARLIMSTRKFHEIFALEADAINKRRAKNNRPAMALEQEDCERDGTPVMRSTPASRVIGLALWQHRSVALHQGVVHRRRK